MRLRYAAVEPQTQLNRISYRTKSDLRACLALYHKFDFRLIIRPTSWNNLKTLSLGDCPRETCTNCLFFLYSFFRVLGKLNENSLYVCQQTQHFFSYFVLSTFRSFFFINFFVVKQKLISEVLLNFLLQKIKWKWMDKIHIYHNIVDIFKLMVYHFTINFS